MVGLDPRLDLLPVELRGDVTRFCCGIVDAVAPYAVAVKPQLVDQSLKELAPLIGKGAAVLSIAAGRPLASLAKPLPKGTAIVRPMPRCSVRSGSLEGVVEVMSPTS